MDIEKDIKQILISEEEIKEIIKRLGEQISNDYKGKEIIAVSVLKGAVVFFSDILREIKCDCQIDFMSVSSYIGTKSTGVVNIKKDVDIDISGKDVLVIEDILDSGITLSHLIELFKKRNANSVKICTFLDKPENRKADIEADYVGKVVPDEFVVGYGLDYNEKYRNLPFIGILDPSVYQNK